MSAKRNITGGQRGGSRRGANEENLRRQYHRLEIERDAWRLFVSGLSISEIGRKVGRHKSTVSRWLSARAVRLAGFASVEDAESERLQAVLMLSRTFTAAFEAGLKTPAAMERAFRIASRMAILCGAIRPEDVAEIQRRYSEKPAA